MWRKTHACKSLNFDAYRPVHSEAHRVQSTLEWWKHIYQKYLLIFNNLSPSSSSVLIYQLLLRSLKCSSFNKEWGPSYLIVLIAAKNRNLKTANRSGRIVRIRLNLPHLAVMSLMSYRKQNRTNCNLFLDSILSLNSNCKNFSGSLYLHVRKQDVFHETSNGTFFH